jgi:hypothetical protein
MQKHLKFICFVAFILSFTLNLSIKAQSVAQISSSELVYNFGNINEEDGLASHVFVVKNTGTGPLVITRITASCGCTQPEWSKEPIAAGKTGNVKVTYNPKGRPGPFYKTITIYSNGGKGFYNLAIKGNVIVEGIKPEFLYPYNIGDMKIEMKNILISSIRSEEVLAERVSITNSGKTSLTVHFGKLPHYLSIEVKPAKLAPDEVGEITILMNAKDVRRKGRVTCEIPVTVRSIGQKEVSENLHFAANVIDNFNKLSNTDRVKAPTAQLSGTLLEFGKLPSGRSRIPLIGSKVSGLIGITNTGRSPLIIYSATCDDPRVNITGGKREIKSGSSTSLKVTLRPREILTRLETLVTIVCNDPTGPVRLVKVTADK